MDEPDIKLSNEDVWKYKSVGTSVCMFVFVSIALNEPSISFKKSVPIMTALILFCYLYSSINIIIIHFNQIYNKYFALPNKWVGGWGERSFFKKIFWNRNILSLLIVILILSLSLLYLLDNHKILLTHQFVPLSYPIVFYNLF